MAEERPSKITAAADTSADDQIGFHTAFSASAPNVINVALQQNVHQSILSAEEIAALRAADPDAANLLYRMIERQQIHDHTLELKTLRSDSLYRLCGILAAVTVVVGLLCISSLALSYGYPTTAAIFGASALLTSVASVFIRGRALPSGPSPDGGLHSPAGQGKQERPTTAPPPPRS